DRDVDALRVIHRNARLLVNAEARQRDDEAVDVQIELARYRDVGGARDGREARAVDAERIAWQSGERGPVQLARVGGLAVEAQVEVQDFQREGVRQAVYR